MLAAAVSLDASHISRLRHGNRRLPKNQTYLMPISQYFSRQLPKKIIADALGIKGSLPNDEKQVAGLLYDWLLDSVSESDASVDMIIKNFSGEAASKIETGSAKIEDMIKS